MLAIIIPYYKLTFFDITLQSLANQTDKRFKVYIGDDASPENPIDLLVNYEGKFDFIYHRFETNLGGISLTQHWERCITLSDDEEWLMIFGDDDILGENAVEEFYKFTQLNNGKSINLIRFGLKIIDEFGVVQCETFDYDAWESTDRLLERMFSLRETITTSEFVFKRSVYMRNNGFVDFPLAWFSDYATWLLYGKGSGIYNLLSANVFWRLSGLNISSKSTDLKEIGLKVAGLFLFMSFLHENFEIKKTLSRDYILANLEWHMNECRFYEIIMILKKHSVAYRFDFFSVIFLFVFKKVKKKFYY